MRFVIYKGIIISVFCKGTFMSGALCEMPFSVFCRMWPFREMQPRTWGFEAAQTRHTLQQRWQELGWWWGLPAGVGHKEQLALLTSGGGNPVWAWASIALSLHAFFTVFPKCFLTGFCFLLSDVNNWSMGLSRSSNGGFAVWLYHLFVLFSLSTLRCVLQRATIALAVEGKANKTCQTPLLLNSH